MYTFTKCPRLKDMMWPTLMDLIRYLVLIVATVGQRAWYIDDKGRFHKWLVQKVLVKCTA